MKNIKKTLSLLLALLTLFAMAFLPIPGAAGSPAADTARSYTTESPFRLTASAAASPCVDYTHTIFFVASKTIPVYTNAAFSSRGSAEPYRKYNSYIEKDDIVQITHLSSPWLYVYYPAGSTYKRGYIRRSDVMPSERITESTRARSGAVTYKYPNGGRYGSVFKNDLVFKVGERNGWTGLIYPIDNGNYKLSFLSTDAYNAYIANTPIGWFDSAVCPGTLQMSLAGWSFDPDNTAAGVEMHAYLGGPAGTKGAWCVSLGKATAYRPDVNRVYGCGNYHGFNKTVTVPERFSGTQTVYLYAINVGGGTGNPLIGTKQVVIKGRSDSGAAAQAFRYPMTDAQVKSTSNNWREYSYSSSRPDRSYHVGLDLTSKTNDPNVYACANGTVAATGYNSANGYYVILQHTLSGKTVYSFYCHLSSYCVSSGEGVSKGRQIGVFGNTGSSSRGAHLHFAIVDTLKNGGGYYGYVSAFTGDKTTYGSVTFYNPHYVIQYQKLP